MNRVRHQPRRVSFKVAKRYLRKPDRFMSCEHGHGWILYRYHTKRKQGAVGNEGRKSIFMAYVDNVPETNAMREKYGLWVNYWTNPSNL